MVYKERFIAVVKCQGKNLREHGEVVTLPFGSEYSLLLKNLESRPASVSINIDGTDVLGGNTIIIKPNSETEIERFIESLSEGNRFKFIQKTKEIQDHRGDKVDDGLIRVEFQYEKEKPVRKEVIHDHHHHHDYHWHQHHNCHWCGHWPCECPPYKIHWTNNSSMSDFNISSNLSSRGMTKGVSNISNDSGDAPVATAAVYHSSLVGEVSMPLEDEGITVKGSISDQKFVYGDIGILEPQKHTIILRLRGTKSNGVTMVKKPITTQSKVTCPTCGKRSRSSSQFCNQCGTSLV